MTGSIISNTRTLKRRIVDKFSEYISFYRKYKYLRVNSSNVNSCEYVFAILKRKRLKDYDTIRSFCEMTRRKINIAAEEKQSSEWPYNPQDIIEMLDKERLSGIYNTIFYTIHEKYVTNKYGYAKTESS